MRHWWRCGAGAFAFGFPPPFFTFGGFPHRPYWSKEQYRTWLKDYLQDLEAYRKDLDEQIEEMKKELEGLGS